MVKLSRTRTGRTDAAASRVAGIVAGLGAAALRGAREDGGAASDFAAAFTAVLTLVLLGFAAAGLAGAADLAALAAVLVAAFAAGLTAFTGAALARAAPFAATVVAADFLGITDSIVQQAKQYSRFGPGLPMRASSEHAAHARLR
jgi:hypothetical protein